LNKNKSVLNYIDTLRDEIIDFAKELIKVPTVNPPGENYENCAKLIEKKLNEIGLSTNIIEVPKEKLPELAPHAKGLSRPNVLAELRGSKDKLILHLNGHYDVVPVGAGWTKEPFAPVMDDCKLYGRGAADQKCGLTAAIMATKALRESGVSLKGNLTLSATPDEETGRFGNNGIISLDVAFIDQVTQSSKPPRN
jgi:succinyl-diaminopimelate desuccinylase